MKHVLALAAALLLPAVALTAPAAAQSPSEPPKAPTHAVARPTPRAVPVVAHQTPLILQAPLLPATSGFSPAPVPNLDISAPSAAPRVGPEFSGSLIGPRDSSVANGYTAGSQYSTDLERRSRGLGNSFAPTLSLKIPFVYANQQLP